MWEKNSPVLWFPASKGLFIKAGGREELARLGRVQLAGSRPEKLEPFSCVLKRAWKGRESRSGHTLGGCWLARALGTRSLMAGYGAQPGSPPRKPLQNRQL